MSKLLKHSHDRLDMPFYLLLGLLFLLPIPLGANRPWAWSFFEICIFSLSIYTCIKMPSARHVGLSKYMSMIYLWLGFIFLALLQIIPLPEAIVSLLSPASAELYSLSNADTFYLSIDSGQSTINFIKLLSLFCLMTLIMQLVNSEKRIKLLLLTMLAAGTFQALYGTITILSGAQTSLVFDMDIKNRATGSFVYHNHFANFLLLSLAAGIGLIVAALEKDKSMSKRDRLRTFIETLLGSKTIVRIGLAIIVIGLVMSRSRMGNVAFFASVAIVGLIALMLIRNRSNGLLIFVVSMFIIDLFIVSAYFGLERVKDRLAQTSLANESRDEIVADALPIIQDFPLFGSGAGSFYSIFPQYQQNYVSAFYDHAHNDYLQFVIEFGLVGAFILLAICLFTFYKAFRAMYLRKNSIFKGTSFAVAVAVLGMCIHISVDFPLQGYANACYFVVFIALAMISNSLKLKKPSSRKSSDKPSSTL
ncbi:O-antigen ligase family protein [Ningiella sp. W23]|uniref:O-antigen ligase family protein n=1 Tax=Ningiella sp. W23 TaxID=3023715 RepID=UPI00375631E2